MNNELFVGNVRVLSSPRIILICGPGRSGTTALAHLFIRAGLESHMQPIKSMLRAYCHGERIRHWTIGRNGNGAILSKETIGPNEECEFFNPVRILVELGYPREQILPLLIVRDPHQNLASWRDLWNKADLENFVRAYRKMEEIADYCGAQGISFINFVHDCIKDHPVEVIVRELFRKCDIATEAKEVVNWVSAPRFGPDQPGNPHVIFYDRPPEKFIHEVSDRGAYVYKERHITEAVREFVARHPAVTEIYNDFRHRCGRDFATLADLNGQKWLEQSPSRITA